MHTMERQSKREAELCVSDYFRIDRCILCLLQFDNHISQLEELYHNDDDLYTHL